jgi:hypothetical protein
MTYQIRSSDIDFTLFLVDVDPTEVELERGYSQIVSNFLIHRGSDRTPRNISRRN